MIVNDWYDDAEKPMDEVTVKAFDEMCELLFMKRDAIDAQKDLLKELSADYEALEKKVLSYLSEFGKKKHICKFGTLDSRPREYWKVPKGEGRDAFFSYLKEKGLFDNLITVNSQTMNSFVKAEVEAARESGDINFRVPGLDEPTVVDIIYMKKDRSKT